MAALARPFAKYGSSRQGTSAIEFAIAFPVLIALMLAGTQVVLYVNAVRKVEQVAASVSEMISQAPPPQGSSTATVNAADLHFSYDATLVIFPYLMKDAASKGIQWWHDLQINYASISFQPVANNCPGSDQSACYSAKVNWTSVGVYGGQYRPCVPLQGVIDDNATPSPSALPRSIFGPGSLIAIDVSFNFVPTFASRLLPPLLIQRSVFVQPRYASVIQFNLANNDGIAMPCP